MNELQIRLTADIQGLQSAINKAKQTLKSFESETATDSEKSNVGFRRKIGLIEKLNADAKRLKVSLTQATSKEKIAAFNAELEQTNIKLAELNALGKTFSAPAVRSFENLKSSAGAATGSAIAFSRIIQDAPFGIIGVANNLQSFGEQFVALGGKATTAGQRLSMFFSALITPANLAILAVSALTAAWQAYSLGLFDSEEETRDLNKELEDFKNNLDGITKAQLEGAQSAQSEIQSFKLLKLQAENANLPLEKRILAVEELRNQFPDYFKGLSDEEILLGNVGDAYDKLTKSITASAKARAFSDQITENEKKNLTLLLQEQERAQEILAKYDELAKAEETDRQRRALGAAGGAFGAAAFSETEFIQGQIDDLIQQTVDSSKQRTKIALETLSIEAKIPAEIEKAGSLIDSNTESYKELNAEVEKLKRTFEELINLPNGGLPREGDVEALRARFQRIREGGRVGQTGQEFIASEINKVKEAGIITERPLGNITDQLKEEAPKIQDEIGVIVDAFSSLGAGIAASLNIGDRALRGFVTTLLSQTPKIIAAIIQQAAANKAAAASNIATDKAQSLAGGVKLAVDGAKGLGPVGLAVLPVLIAGAVALISSAFSKTSGGGSVSAGTGTTFTNRREFGGPVSKGRAYIVGERRPELFVPNTNGIIVPQLPSMDYSGARVNSSMYGVEVMLKGPDDLLFFVEQAQIRRGLR